MRLNRLLVTMVKKRAQLRAARYLALLKERAESEEVESEEEDCESYATYDSFW